jgi:hypothetical protein
VGGEFFCLLDAVGGEGWVRGNAGGCAHGAGVGACCWVDGPVGAVLWLG